MCVSHIRMMIYDLKFLGTKEYNSNESNYEPTTRIIDNEATISMAIFKKDTAGNCHVAQRYHYVRQGTALNEHKFEWIGTKHQLTDTLTKPGTPTTFLSLRTLQMVEIDEKS